MPPNTTRSKEMIRLKPEEMDVVKNYHWSVSHRTEALNEVPTIVINEYQQNQSSIQQGIRYWANQAKVVKDTKGQTADPYAALYSVEKSERGNSYVFPFYSTYNHVIQNAWGENKGTIGEIAATIQNAVTTAAKAVFPSAGIESAKSWEGTTPQQYQFMFHLLNTVHPKEDIAKNRKLIDALINNNLLDKIDFISIRPPAICEIKIPGVRATNIGVMAAINVENVGQINNIDGLNIPDAYQITITVQELLTESRQIYAGALDGGKVFSFVDVGPQGVSDPGAILDNASNTVASVGDIAGGAL